MENEEAREAAYRHPAAENHHTGSAFRYGFTEGAEWGIAEGIRQAREAVARVADWSGSDVLGAIDALGGG